MRTMTVSNERAQVREAVEKMAATSRRLRVVAGCALALLLAVGANFLVYVARTGVAGGAGVPEVALLALQAVMAGLGVAIVAVIISLMTSAAKDSPFSQAQATKLALLAALFAACALLATLGSVGMAGAYSAGALAAGGVEDKMNIIYIDVLLILAAIVSFYLSCVYRYGSFLQWLYDETF